MLGIQESIVDSNLYIYFNNNDYKTLTFLLKKFTTFEVTFKFIN